MLITRLAEFASQLGAIETRLCGFQFDDAQLNEQKKLLDAREKAQDRRQAAQNNRHTAQDTREKSQNRRDRLQDKRDAELTQREQALAQQKSDDDFAVDDSFQGWFGTGEWGGQASA